MGEAACHCRINIDYRLYNKSTLQYCASIVVPGKTKMVIENWSWL